MINSMTGYGDAQGEINGVTYTVEIKAVNNRYLKTIIKLPEAVAFLDEDIDKLLHQNLSRGTANYTLRLKNTSKHPLCDRPQTNVLFDIDETALRATIEKLSALTLPENITYRIDIGSMLALPGILSPVTIDDKIAGQLKEHILNITQQAIEKLKQMRTTEGALLATDLDKHCKVINEKLDQIRTHSTSVLQQYQKKLMKKTNDLLAEKKLKLDEETLAREVAILAEKSDISEELARLDSHIQQFVKSGQSNDRVGRRLDFISQEMLREANTIASKAADIEIIRCVIDIKCSIDRIKEQIQNIE